MAVTEITKDGLLFIPEDGGTPYINGMNGEITVFRLEESKCMWWVRMGNEYQEASEEHQEVCRQIAQTYFDQNGSNLLPEQIQILKLLLA